MYDQRKYRSPNEVSSFASQILDWLEPLVCFAYRLPVHTESGAIQSTIPTLRGVWGRALHLLDKDLYNEVFEGSNSEKEKTPTYIIRPCREDTRSVEWIIWGKNAIKKIDRLRRAWDIAGGMGLGEHRTPFVVENFLPLPSVGQDYFSVSEMGLQNDTESPERSPCRILFPYSVRLMRHSKLLVSPTFSDLVEAAFFRLAPLVAEAKDMTKAHRPRELWPDFAEAAIALASTTPSLSWQGDRVTLERYSGRQKREVQQQCITGHLELPNGLGPLWPLFLAATVFHLGKSTVMGLGRVVLLTR